MTIRIGELRKEFMEKELKDKKQRKKWQEAADIIARRMAQLRSRPDGDFIYERVNRMLKEMESALPLFDEKEAKHDSPGEFDNLRSYITDIHHGLAHSLDMLGDALEVADIAYPNPAKRRREQEVMIGVALYHDLTGLRNRVNHHISARDLVVGILDMARDARGEPVYDRELVDLIARGCQNHRGQNYPAPESETEQIILDVDEYNLVKPENFDRAFNQYSRVTFDPEFFDCFREMSLIEKRKQGSNERHKHEDPNNDRLGYAS